MAEFYPTLSPNFADTSYYLTKNRGPVFSNLNWKDPNPLSTGTVLRLSHTNTDRITIFECTDIQPSKIRALGLLSVFNAGKPTEEARQPAHLRLQHINPYLAALPGIHFAQFSFTNSEGSSINLLPAFDTSEVYMHGQLRAESIIQTEEDATRRRLAQLTLGEAADHLADLADHTDDANTAQKYRIASEVMKEEFPPV